MEKDYYLGLDIGTDSVGWAVYNPYYQILKFKGNSMWGIRLFDESCSAEKRREFRSGRRRNQRKRERIALLEMLFDKEICKVDPAFLLNSMKAICILMINQQMFFIAFFPMITI